MLTQWSEDLACLNFIIAALYNIAIRVVDFSSGGTKLERFLTKNQHTQRKLLNFENGTNGKVSKIERHFSNKVI